MSVGVYAVRPAESVGGGDGEAIGARMVGTSRLASNSSIGTTLRRVSRRWSGSPAGVRRPSSEAEVPVGVRPVRWAVSPPCLVEDVRVRGFDLRESAYE